MMTVLLIAAVVLLSRQAPARSAPGATYTSPGYAPPGFTSTDAGQPPKGEGPNPLEVFLGGTATGQAVTDEVEEKKKMADELARLAREGGQKAATATDAGLAWLVRHVVP